MRIRNDGTVADRLIGGTMEAAGRVEIHEMAVVDGIMRMRELGNGLEIPPLGIVELRPGSFHVMFLDLARPLRQGEKLKGTLRFANAGVANVEYEVGAMGAGPDGQAHRH
jgi:copper(I)-binding protein